MTSKACYTYNSVDRLQCRAQKCIFKAPFANVVEKSTVLRWLVNDCSHCLTYKAINWYMVAIKSGWGVYTGESHDLTWMSVGFHI